jgi:ureidoacrylate peracid hydrolase
MALRACAANIDRGIRAAGAAAARNAGFRVFNAMHRRYRPGDYETWKYIAPIQMVAWERKPFEYGTSGGEIRPEFEPKPGEIVATERWCSEDESVCANY